MKNIFDFIIESLINSSDLNEKLKFEEIDIDELKEILYSDDYDNGKVLEPMDVDPDNFEDDIWLVKIATKYKIVYDNNIIGLFTITYPKDLKNLVMYSEKNEYYHHNYNILYIFFKPLIKNSIDKKFKDEIIFDLDFTNSNIKDRNTSSILDEVIRKTCYINLWVINKKIKKKLDINDFALVKVFFNKLIKHCKEKNIKYMFAHGKDERTQKMYIKLGGFKSFYKTNNKYFAGGDDEFRDMHTKGFVGKEI